MFEYIVAAFKIIVGLLSAERLAIIACIVYGIYVIWILLSLLFSFQSKFSRNCRKISELVDAHGLTAETYPKFVELGDKLPDSFLRGWKTFEHSDKGLPSEYIKRSECLDLELEGGLFNQNRSTMRSYIYGFGFFFAILGVALIGNAALTGYAIAEALLIPFLFIVVSMLTYYLYTAIRQHQYKIAVEDFNEMMDILNEKVESSEVEFANRNRRESAFVKNVVEPRTGNDEKIVLVDAKVENQKEASEAWAEETEEVVQFDVPKENNEVALPTAEELQMVNEYAHEENGSSVEPEVVLSHQVEAGEEQTHEQISDHENMDAVQPQEPETSFATLENEHTVVYNSEESQETQGEEPMEDTTPVQEVKRGRGRPRKEKTDDGELIIKSDAEFEEVLARAEKLMRKNEEPLSASQQKRVEKALKELVDAMKKYKGEM